jgi:hypothetical protein
MGQSTVSKEFPLQQRFTGKKGEASVFQSDGPIENCLWNVTSTRRMENNHFLAWRDQVLFFN